MLNTTAAIVLFLGAVFITIVGAVANYATQTEGNKINGKTLSRDFVIGLALSGAAYFFVPDSFDSLGKSIQEVTESIPSVGGAKTVLSSSNDFELHVGPSPF